MAYPGLYYLPHYSVPCFLSEPVSLLLLVRITTPGITYVFISLMSVSPQKYKLYKTRAFVHSL